MPTGKVKFFDDVKGFGFIASDEGNEVYLHASALPDGMTAVKPGTRIEFSVVDSKLLHEPCMPSRFGGFQWRSEPYVAS